MLKYIIFAFSMVFTSNLLAAVSDISPLGKVRVKNSSPQAAKLTTTKTDNSAQQIYTKSCFACHDSGVLGAPILGNKSHWTPRIALGIDILVKSAITGKGAMPPKGGAITLSDAEIKQVVDYMVSKVQ